MAKNTKKRTTAHGKPITDFFTLASKPNPQSGKSWVSPSMSQASSSQDIRATGASKTTGMLLDKSKVASIASKCLTESSSKPHDHELLDDSKTSSSQYPMEASSSKPLFASSAATSSLKRVRSPDFQTHARASTPLNDRKVRSDSVKTPDRRRGKFDSDSDIETPNTIVYVNSTVCHSLISQWFASSNILLVQFAKPQESPSFASRGSSSSGLPCSEQPV